MENELIKGLVENKAIKEFIKKNSLDEKEILFNYSSFSQFKEVNDICINCNKKECNSVVENMTCNLELITDDLGRRRVKIVYEDCNEFKPVLPGNLEVINYTEQKVNIETTSPRAKLFALLSEFKKEYSSNTKGLVKGIYLHGKFGVGKSLLMYEFAKTLAKEGSKVIFVYYPDFVRTIQSSFGNGEQIEDLIYRLKTCDILMLDDIGREANTSYIRDEILGPILQFRCDNSLPMFATSNRNFNLIEDHLSDANGKIDKVKARAIVARFKYLMNEYALEDKDFRNN